MLFYTGADRERAVALRAVGWFPRFFVRCVEPLPTLFGLPMDFDVPAGIVWLAYGRGDR